MLSWPVERGQGQCGQCFESFRYVAPMAMHTTIIPWRSPPSFLSITDYALSPTPRLALSFLNTSSHLSLIPALQDSCCHPRFILDEYEPRELSVLLGSHTDAWRNQILARTHSKAHSFCVMSDLSREPSCLPGLSRS